MQPEQLISAIRAALDETERVALAAEGACWHVDYCDDYGQPFHELFDPAAVLRRVAADREIVDAHDAAARFAASTGSIHAYTAAETWYRAVIMLARGLGINPEEETP